MDQPLTYQELLAHQYEENANAVLVMQQDYTDEIDEHEEDGHVTANLEEIENPHEFNRFQPRHAIKNVIQPDKSDFNPLRQDVLLRKRVLNIDSKFRGLAGTSASGNAPSGSGTGTGFETTPNALPETQITTTSSYFMVYPSRNFNNITSIHLTSFEFPNVFYTFTNARKNTSFDITITRIVAPTVLLNYPVKIREGNYTIPQLIAEILPQLLFGKASGTGIPVAGSPTVTMAYDSVTNKFFFYIPPNIAQTFEIRFPYSNFNPSENGIGYNLGFYSEKYQKFETITIPDPAQPGAKLNVTALIATHFPDLAPDSYIYVCVNDYDLVEHQEYGQTHFSALARITLPVDKGSSVFMSTYVDTSDKKYHFPQPVNLTRFEIKLIDAYGSIIDIKNANFSMTLELQEIIDFRLYQKMLEF